eukprot:TRINITY_DN5208_c0_g1_i1.p1 TRINITY_DN5208_c0_g1~~TRINITY_DN5208_c0_g1_i1.p1  ORF type:complete len:187 (+),score=44.43 TRINITY_DN5208_c0_g1_i1:31-561(+)
MSSKEGKLRTPTKKTKRISQNSKKSDSSSLREKDIQDDAKKSLRRTTHSNGVPDESSAREKSSHKNRTESLSTDVLKQKYLNYKKKATKYHNLYNEAQTKISSLLEELKQEKLKKAPEVNNNNIFVNQTPTVSQIALNNPTTKKPRSKLLYLFFLIILPAITLCVMATFFPDYLKY